MDIPNTALEHCKMIEMEIFIIYIKSQLKQTEQQVAHLGVCSVCAPVDTSSEQEGKNDVICLVFLPILASDSHLWRRGFCVEGCKLKELMGLNLILLYLTFRFPFAPLQADSKGADLNPLKQLSLWPALSESANLKALQGTDFHKLF